MAKAKSDARARRGGAGPRRRGGGDGQEVRVVLADDHPGVLTGLRMIFASDPAIEVVAEAGEADTAIERVAELEPDVLILDLYMAGSLTLDQIPRIRQRSPRTKVITLTMEDDPRFARAAFERGARGFVVKRTAGRSLLDAVREVAAGGRYVGARLVPPGSFDPEA